MYALAFLRNKFKNTSWFYWRKEEERKKDRIGSFSFSTLSQHPNERIKVENREENGSKELTIRERRREHQNDRREPELRQGM